MTKEPTAVKPVVSKIVNILPSAQFRCKLREKFMGAVKTLSEIFSQHCVLTDPVNLRSCDGM